MQTSVSPAPSSSPHPPDLDRSPLGQFFWITRLRYYARQLAESRISMFGTRRCDDCRREQAGLDTARHAAGCRVGQVLHAIGMLDRIEASISSPVAVTPAPEVASAGAGDLSSGQQSAVSGQFGEPWEISADGPKNLVAYASDPGHLTLPVHEGFASELLQEDEIIRFARRIRACVNFCAEFDTELLEKAAPHERRALVAEALRRIEAIAGVALGEPRGEDALFAAAAEKPAGLPYLRPEDRPAGQSSYWRDLDRKEGVPPADGFSCSHDGLPAAEDLDAVARERELAEGGVE